MASSVPAVRRDGSHALYFFLAEADLSLQRLFGGDDLSTAGAHSTVTRAG